MLKKKHIFIPLCLLTLFVAYQVSITMFAHVHYVNGVMIVHSHPSTDNEHTHSDSQILTLTQVSNWGSTEPVLVTLSEVNLSVFDTLECERKSRVLSDWFSYCISLRAPPFCFWFWRINNKNKNRKINHQWKKWYCRLCSWLWVQRWTCMPMKTIR